VNSNGLTEHQIEVARAFFELDTSKGFVVSGGAALLALGLSTRPTQDLDIFTSPPINDVKTAMRSFKKSAESRGWDVEIIVAEDTFCRFTVSIDGDVVLVDLAVDSALGNEPTMSILGPTMPADEVAARKVLALFDRAAARDFVDVYQLSQVFDKDDLLRRAAEIDLGFNIEVFAEMLNAHRRFVDTDFYDDVSAATRMREFFDEWHRAL
jgi:hypothetical protein